MGLRPGIPVATAIIDAHVNAAACGIDGPEKLLIIIGTSSCHMLQSKTVGATIEGIQGVVKDGMIPDFTVMRPDSLVWATSSLGLSTIASLKPMPSRQGKMA